jgi:hypothetical protein
MKISPICTRYLAGFTEIKKYKSNNKTETFIAALKVFSYLSIILPVAALSIRYLCGRVSKKTTLSKMDQKVDSNRHKMLPEHDQTQIPMNSLIDKKPLVRTPSASRTPFVPSESPSSLFNDYRLAPPRTPLRSSTFANSTLSFSPIPYNSPFEKQPLHPLNQLDFFITHKDDHPNIEIVYTKRIKNLSCSNFPEETAYLSGTLTAINLDEEIETFAISSIIGGRLTPASPNSSLYKTITDFDLPAKHYEMIRHLLKTQQGQYIEIVVKTTLSNLEYVEEKFSGEDYAVKGDVNGDGNSNSLTIPLGCILGARA